MNEVAVKQQLPSDIIRLAVEKGSNLDQIEKLMILQERWEANEARKAYNEAITFFKKNAPQINKDKSVSFGAGKTAYKHASLFNVTQKISAKLSEYGLSASWRVKQNGVISVTTIISHVLGHSEETTLSAPSDTSGSKNPIQAIGSTISYLERYGLLAMTGLATFDMDDDGNQTVTEFISEKEYSQLIDHINNEGLKEQAVCEYLKVEKLSELPKEKLQMAMRIKKAVKK